MAKKILKAVQQENYVELTVVDIDSTGTEVSEHYSYALTEDDPYGDAPALRDELHRMVDAGEIVIEEPDGAT